MNDSQNVVNAPFRDVMSRVCTPVSVVTSLDGSRPHGTTVSAFASLSMDPPMVMLSLDRRSDLLALIRNTEIFGMNILSENQSELASTFARKGHDKFTSIEWEVSSSVPRLPNVSAFLACSVSTLVEGGDHIVVLGLVRTSIAGAAPPLTYHDRAFGTHTALGPCAV